MVLKKGKHGISKGNTIRKPQQWKFPANDGLIIRRNFNIPDENQIPDKIFGFVPDVFYSLKKQARWKTLSCCKNNLHQKIPNDEEVKISILERLCCKRRSHNCVYYANTDGVVKHSGCSPDRFGCSSTTPEIRYDVIYSTGPYSTHYKERRKARKCKFPWVKRAIHSTSDDSPALTVDVHGPVYDWNDHDSYEDFEDPELGLNEDQAPGLNEDQEPAVKRTSLLSVSGHLARHRKSGCFTGQYGKSRKCSLHDIKFCLSDETLNETDDWQNEIDLELVESEYCRKQEFTLYDFIIESHPPSHQKKRHCRAKRHRKKMNFESQKKGKIIYEDKSDRGPTIIPRIKKDARVNNINMDVKPPWLMILARDTLPCALQQKFGSRYVECSSTPRRFIIDMTNDIRIMQQKRCTWVSKYMRFLTISTKHLQTIDATACLVFWKDETENDFDLDSIRFKFCVNMDSQYKGLINNCSLADIVTDLKSHQKNPDQNHFSIDDIVSSAASNIRNVIKQKCQNNPLQSTSSRVRVIAELNQWPRCSSFFPGHLDVCLVHTQITDSSMQLNKEISTSMSCAICLDKIDTKDNSSTALVSCGHWFCNNCWRDHLTSRINNGICILSCPQYNCDSVVDLGTVVSLVNMSTVRKHLLAKEDSTIQTSSGRFWCTKPNCGRVVQLDRAGIYRAAEVRCCCGHSFCLQCRSEPHWPASCRQALMYVTKLHRYGDSSVAPTDVLNTSRLKGKRCPQCSRFIEKNSGCPHMTCICGANFCWRCLQKWGLCRGTICNAKSDLEKTENYADVIMESIQNNKSSRSKFYMKAISHRHQYGIFLSTFEDLQKQLSPFHRKYKQYLSKQAMRRCDVCPEQCLNKMDRAFILMFELHHVIEFTSVALDSMSSAHLGWKSSLSRLEFILSRLQTIFSDGVNNKMKELPERIETLTTLASTILKSFSH